MNLQDAGKSRSTRQALHRQGASAPDAARERNNHNKKRFISVWLPMFAIDRMREAVARKTSQAAPSNHVPHDEPFVLVQSGVHGLSIAAVNERARAEGLAIGQPLADARAALPALITRPAEPERDRRRLYALAHAGGRYGPARNVEGEDGLWVDITGAAHLFGGESALARDLLKRLSKTGFRAQLGIADTPAAAFALARYGVSAKAGASAIAIAPPGEASKAMAGLPVEALRLEAQTATLLRRLGLRRVGQLYGLPRSALARRFRDLKGKGAGRAAEREGRVQAVLMRLDQALGERSDPRVPLSEPPFYIVRRSYPEILITSEGITTACHELAGELCTILEVDHKGARRLRLALYRADGGVAQAVIGTSRPCREAGHLIELFRDKLERLDAGLGIDMITLEALEVEGVTASQVHFKSRGPGSRNGSSDNGVEERSALLDRLVNRLGVSAVYRLGPVASHIPERAQTHVTDFNCGAEQFSQKLFNRPPFLFMRPEPITVIAEVPEGAPKRFTWRRVLHRVVKADGPERIAPEWWRWLRQLSDLEDGAGACPAEARIRDYYRLEDDYGSSYWVYRAGLYRHEGGGHAPAWFIHGLYG